MSRAQEFDISKLLQLAEISKCVRVLVASLGIVRITAEQIKIV